ncbi:hypothetical protein P280DRAFT_191615 [Massarina eburnea CBS 473.64]|uniref:Integral membrane protein n=1 Tax=Massarina eburnea CBS 473.64 TaxID=1395130 RepID=A0A6A6RKI9_9PLEO|nr:hypothetical protein P280DRAFT_191615 [Massarina eburnea CBS 473.64]
MNASATIRSAYVRASVMSMSPSVGTSMTPIRELAARPADETKLRDFKHINHLEHRENCEHERVAEGPLRNITKNVGKEQAYITGEYTDSNTSFMDFEERGTFKTRLRKMYTVFPYKDPIYLVAVVFLLGSIDLVLNAFFDLLPRTIPSSEFETEETIAVPATVLIGSIFFFAAGIFDTFGALNADRGTLETSKEDLGNVTYMPALLGSPEFKWIPSRIKFIDLTTTNLAFQAGLIVLLGGVIFMFAGIVDFPGVVDEESSLHASIVFGPQIVHGFLFLVANAMLAISEQEKWYKPKLNNADWQGAFLNAVGGLGFMMAGFFLFRDDEVLAAIAAMAGSWAFVIGSLVRLYVTMDIY